MRNFEKIKMLEDNFHAFLATARLLFCVVIILGSASAKLRGETNAFDDSRQQNYGLQDSAVSYPGYNELSLLLGKIKVEDFMKEYFERKVLHVKASDEASGSETLSPNVKTSLQELYGANSRLDLFSRKKLDEVLNTQKIYNEISTRFVVKDDDVDATHHKESHGEDNDRYDDENNDMFDMGNHETIVTPGLVDEHLREKRATMLFKHLEMHVPALKKFTCALANGFGARSGVNMYLTPPKSVGFLNLTTHL